MTIDRYLGEDCFIVSFTKKKGIPKSVRQMGDYVLPVVSPHADAEIEAKVEVLERELRQMKSCLRHICEEIRRIGFDQFVPPSLDGSDNDGDGED